MRSGRFFSGVAFLYQATYRVPSGELFRQMPLAWTHLLGHLLRAVGLGAIGWTLARYARSAKVGLGTDTDRARLFADLGLIWFLLALFVGVMLVFGFGSVWLLHQAQLDELGAGGRRL